MILGTEFQKKVGPFLKIANYLLINDKEGIPFNTLDFGRLFGKSCRIE